MDANKMMIIAKGRPISSNIVSYEFNSLTNQYDITFKNGKSYHYNAQNVSFLHDPDCLDPQGYRIRHRGKLLENITAIYAFKDAGTEYWRICYSAGNEYDYCIDELEIDKSVLESDGAKQTFAYLKEVADNVGPNTEDGIAILAKQYERIDFISSETAASVYLNPNEFQSDTDLDLSTLIFPFGCNESQYQAVRNALANRISVIEGPPGTGKTQTILNIIANLVIQGKTIQVISNNNPAIDNIIEKMAAPQYRVDFIAAQLGRAERKEAFINSQNGLYPDLSSWESNEYNTPEFFAELQETLRKLREIFKDKSLLAELRQKLHAIQLEQQYYDDMVVDKMPVIPEKTAKKKLSSEKLMALWQEYQDIQNGNKKAGFLYRFLYYYHSGISFEQLSEQSSDDVLKIVQGLYYHATIEEIRSEIRNLEGKLTRINADALMKDFTKMSMKCFRAMLAKRYGSSKERCIFSKDSLWQKPDEFLKEYPVVLSTSYTARSSLGKNAQFDYVIMDEASQVDVVTGTLATSCAKNAVIVGDTKQLPNVVTSKQKEHLNRIFRRYNIPEAYNYTENSFLKSLSIVLGDKVPHVTLREHYRCHPQIIGFCNEKFYHGDLIVMSDQDATPALQLVTTDAGNLDFNHTNLPQYESIRNEILPNLTGAKSQIGIIAPYSNQVSLLKKRLDDPEVDIATVHRFQGREKDVIILSTVDDTATKFSDDSNLLNVAVSRAKKKLVVVTSNQEQPVGSNTGDLIGYIRYNNCDVHHSAIRPVFSFFYNQSAESRRKYSKTHNRISELDYESEIYKAIIDELEHRENVALGVICHQHMSLLFRDLSKMSAEEQRFVNTSHPQLDFLVFNRVTKLPLLAIEADAFQYHKGGSGKAEWDKLKDHILKLYGIPLLRLSGNVSSAREQLAKELDSTLLPNRSYTLVITEKPSVARAYAKVLSAQNKKYKYLEGNGYLISWCYGHLVELAKPDAYDEKYRNWRIEDLPIIPETWKYKTKSNKRLKKQFNILKQLMNRDDVKEILCATDAGREGELIFRLVYQQAKCDKPIRRIWLSSMEESAIKEAFSNPRPGSDFDNLYESARCRQLADWIVGMNATRYFSLRYGCKGKALRVGRVVSPTMAMIVDREKDIEAFIPETYYTVNLDVGGVTFESRRIETEEEAIQIEQKCRGGILADS